MKGFIGHIYTQLETASDYSTIADFHTYKPPHAKPSPVCSVFISHSLVTASNRGDSSASHAQVLFSQPPMQNSTLN
jgi:hypothetical protein